MPEISTTKRWIDFAISVGYEDLPPEVVRQTKLFILDNIGCALGGYAIGLGKNVVRAGCDLGGKPESTVIGSGYKLHCANAAYVNGKLSNLLDMDEVFYSTKHIGGIPVFPTLALGEREGASGRDVILATALAYDFAARCSFCATMFLSDPEKGFVASDAGTMAFGPLAAATAATKILKLDQKQIAGALTLAAHFAPGPIEAKFVFEPTFTKYGDMGWFCHSGVIATLLAQNGYIGDSTILDGQRGLKKLTGALDFDHDGFVADLGTRWYVMDAGLKPYPTCRWFHTGIKLLEDIIQPHQLAPDDIESIAVYGTPLVAGMPAYVTANKWWELDEKELWLSQFSFTFALACTVYGITPGPEWATNETLNSPLIAQMTKRITHRAHPQGMSAIMNYRGHPARMHCRPPTSIEVFSKKGTFASESWDLPGDSWNQTARLRDEDITAKFKNNARHVLNDQMIEKALELLLNLDSIDNTVDLMSRIS